MTYNEKPFLKEVIPALHHFVDQIVLVDNGSTDGTQEEYLKYCNSNDVLIHSHQGDVPDFGKQRNIALDATEDGAWVLKWDADELPSCAMEVGLREFLRKDNDLHTGWAIGCYHILKYPLMALPFEYGFQHLCLFRKDPGVRWREGTHEQIQIGHPWGGINPERTGIAIIHFSYWCEKRFIRKAHKYASMPDSGFKHPSQLTDRLNSKPKPLPFTVRYMAELEWLNEIKEVG